MDEIEVAAVWLLHKRNAKRKVNRKMWVHPINPFMPEVVIFGICA